MNTPSEADTVSRSQSDSRAFYFWMVVWGDKFRQQFLDFCLPSLLAPGNIPAIAGKRKLIFLFATTEADWELLTASPIFEELRRYVTPTFIELPQPTPGRHYSLRAVDGKKLCMDYIFEKRGYGVFLSPDHLYADGSIESLDELARAGVEVIVQATVTSVEDSVFYEHLERSGLAKRESQRSPIVIKPRQLVAIAMLSMHSMWKVIEWDAPYYWGTSCGAWWRVKGDKGMVMLSVGSEMTLADYGAITKHDSTVLYKNNAGTDGDYTLTNFAHRKFYITRDSDEFYSVGIDPATHNACIPRRIYFGELGKGAEFRATFDGKVGHRFNWLQKTRLFVPSRVHTDPIIEKDWRGVETHALRTLLRWVAPSELLAKVFTSLPQTRPSLAELDQEVASIVRNWWQNRPVLWATERWILPYHRQVTIRAWVSFLSILLHRLILAVQGDRKVIRWWLWSLRKLAAMILRRPFAETRPEV